MFHKSGEKNMHTAFDGQVSTQNSIPTYKMGFLESK